MAAQMAEMVRQAQLDETWGPLSSKGSHTAKWHSASTHHTYGVGFSTLLELKCLCRAIARISLSTQEKPREKRGYTETQTPTCVHIGLTLAN